MGVEKMAHEEDYDDILAAKELQIKSYAIALKIAIEESADLRKERDSLRKIAVREQKEANELRMQVLELERIIRKHEDRWAYRESVL